MTDNNALNSRTFFIVHGTVIKNNVVLNTQEK